MPTMKTTNAAEQDQDELRVTDLNVAAYLLARDHPVVRLEGKAGSRIFVFQGVPHDVIMEYYGGRATIEARKLFSAFRDVKGLALQGF